MSSLLLYADDPRWKPARRGAVVDALRALGLLGVLEQGEAPDRYRVGDRFLSLVMFMGCSPQVALEPDQGASGQEYCSIRLREFEQVTLLCSATVPALRCPRCGATLADPQTGCFDSSNRCDQCGAVSQASELNWRNSGGYARFFIELSGIFPHEAVPADRLLCELARLSNCDWKYLYR